MLTLGKDFIVIKDYKEIKVLGPKEISICMNEGLYDIVGDHLVMTYYDQYEIRFVGKFKVITYEP